MLCRDQVGDNQLGIRDRVGRKRRGVPLRDLCAESLGSLTDGQDKLETGVGVDSEVRFARFLARG